MGKWTPLKQAERQVKKLKRSLTDKNKHLENLQAMGSADYAQVEAKRLEQSLNDRKKRLEKMRLENEGQSSSKNDGRFEKIYAQSQSKMQQSDPNEMGRLEKIYAKAYTPNE